MAYFGCDKPEFVMKREREELDAQRRKVVRMARIAQLEAVDDQKRGGCGLCHSPDVMDGWKFVGYWLMKVALETPPQPWIIVCAKCYGERFGTGRNESEMMKVMKTAPSSHLVYHMTINKGATFAMNRVEPLTRPSERTRTL
eukprot:jgi/Mesvir1/20012/Mv13267-RA.1